MAKQPNLDRLPMTRASAEREIYTGRSENTCHDHRTDRRAAQANISNRGHPGFSRLKILSGDAGSMAPGECGRMAAMTEQAEVEAILFVYSNSFSDPLHSCF